jgi:hypothetical protein
LRWTARRVPVGENVKDVLKSFVPFRSGMDPPIKYAEQSYD